MKYFMQRFENLLASMAVIVSLGLSFGSAQAHPSDDDFLMSIGAGTKLVVKKDINIPAFKQSVTFLNGALTNSPAMYVPLCDMYLRETTSHDRVIKAGTELVFGSQWRSTSDVTYKNRTPLFTSPKGVYQIHCSWRSSASVPVGWTADMRDQLLSEASRISCLKKHADGYFDIVYPEPQVIEKRLPALDY